MLADDGSRSRRSEFERLAARTATALLLVLTFLGLVAVIGLASVPAR